MKHTSLISVGLGGFMAITLVATAARAQGSPHPGPEVAPRTGLLLPLGIEGTYRLMPGQTFVPWVGAGIAYEWASVDYSGGVIGSGSATLKGFQPLLQAGGDIYVTPKLFLGPFVEAAFGRFDSTSTS